MKIPIKMLNTIIKMKFENYDSSMAGDEIEAMMVTWRD